MIHSGHERSRRGSVLMLTLWILLFLCALAAAVGALVSARIELAAGLRDRLVAYAAAEAGVEVARSEARRETNAWTDALQPWSTRTAAMQDVPLGDGTFTIVHLAEDRKGGVTNAPGMGDEESRLNLNQVTNEEVELVFRALLREAADAEPDAAESLAASVADWVDPDDTPRRNGAESAHYRGLPRPYDCRNGPMESLDELLLVKGMTPRLLDRLRPFVTIYGDTRAVNLNTAGPTVLRSLAMAKPGSDGTRAGALVERILDVRGSGQSFRSADKRVLRQALYGPGIRAPAEQEEWVLLEWAMNHRLVSVQSRQFCGISIGCSGRGGPVRQRIGFVLDQQRDGVVGWHEY